MRGHVKITVGPDPHDAKVWIDGHEVLGLCAVGFHLSAHDLPTVTLTAEPEILEYDGPADLLAELADDSEGNNDPDQVVRRAVAKALPLLSIGPRRPRRVCRKCAVPHYEDCDECFGFGMYVSESDHGWLVPVTANKAILRETPGEPVACPSCKSTLDGIPA